MRYAQAIGALRGLGATDLSAWVELHEHDAPYYTPAAAAMMWDYLDSVSVIPKGQQGNIEMVGFGALAPGSALGGSGSGTEWAKRKIALGWDVALPVALVANPSSLGPECETEVGAAAVTPLGIDDAKAIYANLRSKCGAFLPPRAQPPAPAPEPPAPAPAAKQEPELKLASMPPAAIVAVAAVGTAGVVYWLLSR